MNKVRFGDVVRDVKVNVDRTKNPYEYYVAGDHMDTDELRILRRGSFSEPPEPGPAFIREFKPGHILYGSRRTYLRKIAVSDFEGVCANTTFVLETKDENVFTQKLLPFLMYSERFTQYSIKNSKGSTNPYILFSDLAQYEFNLPPIGEQRKLTDLLWAAVDAKNAYKELLAKTDELVKSQFVEMFEDSSANWSIVPLGDLITSIIAGESLNGEARQMLPGERAVLKVSAVTYGYFKADEYKVLIDQNSGTKNVYPQKGDLLFSRANTKEMVGATALVDQDYPDLILPDKLWRLLFDSRVDTVYMKFYLSSEKIRNVLSSMATGTSGSMYNISMEKLKSILVPTPPLDQQTHFASIAQQADKSKHELQRTLDELDATYKALLRENLG